MKHKIQFTGIILLIAGLLISCGPSDEEIERREQARQDSLEQVRQDSLQLIQQQRQDSLEKARADNTAKNKQNQRNVSFTPDGNFAVQVYSWRSQQKAQARAEQWKERGFNNVSVIKHGDESTGDIWFRVRLGRLDSRAAAEQLQQTLQEEYQAQSWISVI